MKKEAEQWTMAIPEAGKKYFGLGRNASYEAAKTGLIPTIDVGPRLKRALVKVLEQRLQQAGKETAGAFDHQGNRDQ